MCVGKRMRESGLGTHLILTRFVIVSGSINKCLKIFGYFHKLLILFRITGQEAMRLKLRFKLDFVLSSAAAAGGIKRNFSACYLPVALETSVCPEIHVTRTLQVPSSPDQRFQRDDDSQQPRRLIWHCHRVVDGRAICPSRLEEFSESASMGC